MIPEHIIFAVAPETKETWNGNTNHNLRETINNRWWDICACYHPLHQRGTPKMDSDTRVYQWRRMLFKITFETPFMEHRRLSRNCARCVRPPRVEGPIRGLRNTQTWKGSKRNTRKQTVLVFTMVILHTSMEGQVWALTVAMARPRASQPAALGLVDNAEILHFMEVRW